MSDELEYCSLAWVKITLVCATPASAQRTLFIIMKELIGYPHVHIPPVVLTTVVPTFVYAFAFFGSVTFC